MSNIRTFGKIYAARNRVLCTALNSTCRLSVRFQMSAVWGLGQAEIPVLSVVPDSWLVSAALRFG